MAASCSGKDFYIMLATKWQQSYVVSAKQKITKSFVILNA